MKGMFGKEKIECYLRPAPVHPQNKLGSSGCHQSNEISCIPSHTHRYLICPVSLFVSRFVWIPDQNLCTPETCHSELSTRTHLSIMKCPAIVC